MDDNKPDLSARYYIAEVSVWMLGVILLVARFLGLAPSQPLPLLNVTLENPQYFLRVVAAMLSAATLYLIWEWKRSSLASRRAYRAQARAGFTTLFSCASLWLSYSLIAANTRFADISPAWYFTFIAVGLSIGLFVSIVAFASLMIRTQAEAKAVNLPRVPVATRTQFVMYIPVVLILLVIYYMLWYFAPDLLKGIGPLLVVLTYILMFGKGVAFLFLSQDEHENHLPYRKRITQLKESLDPIDYFNVLHKHTEQTVQELGVSIDTNPQIIQKKIREKFLETQHDKKKTIRASRIPDNPKYEKQEFEIPINLVESHAAEYIRNYPDQAKETPKKIIQYAVEQSIESMIEQQDRPALQRAVESGQEQQVRDILKQNLDVNERAEAGWTALLYAAAQGYPRIMRLLLDAGANIDMGNVLGLTPLIYGAQYKNVDVCKLLLEYGANPNLQDVYGMTALMVATLVGSAEVAEMLLKAGANTNIKDCNEMTALDIAHKRKQGKIAKIIRTRKKIAASRP